MRPAVALCVFAVLSTPRPSDADGLLARFGRGLLVRRLADADPSARRSAAVELSRRGDQDAVDAIAARVRVEGNLDARRAMLTALGVLRDARAVAVLLEIAARSGDPARTEAVAALGQIGDPRSIGQLAALLSDPRLVQAAASSLAEIGSLALPRLVELLADEQSGPGAAVGLGKLGDARAVPALIATLSAPSPERRAAAATALGALGDPRARKALDAVQRADPDLRTRAAASEALERLVPHREPTGSGIEGLAVSGGSRARRRLEALARRRDLPGRQALRALALVAHPRPAMGAGQPSAILGETCTGALKGRDVDRATDCAFAVGAAEERSSGAVAALQRALTAASPALRREAALALGRLGQVEPLVARFRQEADASVRAAILWALGDHPDAAAIPVVIAALSREVGPAGVDAAAAAGALADRRLAAPLHARLSDPDPLLRANAVLSVGRLGDAGSVATLRSHLDSDPDPLVRANAARAIAMLDPRAALRSLAAAADADSDPEVRAAAADARDAAVAGRVRPMPVGEDVFRSRFVDASGRGTPGVRYAAILPDGRVRMGWADSMGEVVIFDVPRGTTRLWLP